MTGISGAVTNRVMDAFLGGEERDWSAEGLEAAGRSTSPEERGWRTWEESRVEGTSPGLPLEGYVGRYGGPMYGDATVALEDGGLVLRLLPNADLVGDLTHWHHDTFRVTWRTDFSWFGDGLAQFVLDKDGQVKEILLDVPNGDFWFTELELTRREADGGM